NAIGSKGIEIPLCPSHGVLHVRTLRNVFKDATGLKYRNPDTGLDRVLLMIEAGLEMLYKHKLDGTLLRLSLARRESDRLTPTGGWKNKMFTVVRPAKFVRPPGNAKKQVKRSLANKSKAMADMDSNSDGKMRPVLAGSKANCVSAASEVWIEELVRISMEIGILWLELLYMSDFSLTHVLIHPSEIFRICKHTQAEATYAIPNL
ncbi:unnamed protein product, partial [Acanthocheilonema viteae]